MSDLLFLPNEFYESKTYHSRALAVLCLIEPSLTPSREALPRERLHEDLRTILAGNASRYGVSIGREYVALVGMDLMSQLLRLTVRPDVFAFNFPWHLAAVQECLRVEDEHEALIKKIMVTAMNSENRMATFR